MKKYEVTIEGFTPLIYNRMKREFEVEKKVLKKDQLADWEAANWRRKAEYDEGNNLLFPPEWIRGCLINACKSSRKVPHWATSKNQTFTQYFTSLIFSVTRPIGKMLDLIEVGKYVDGQGGRSGSKVWRSRPSLEKWKVVFTVHDISGRMLKDELSEIIDHGGTIHGVGDARAINYGRFSLTKLEEIESV
jgi:hypothetical protein